MLLFTILHQTFATQLWHSLSDFSTPGSMPSTYHEDCPIPLRNIGNEESVWLLSLAFLIIIIFCPFFLLGFLLTILAVTSALSLWHSRFET